MASHNCHDKVQPPKDHLLRPLPPQNFHPCHFPLFFLYSDQNTHECSDPQMSLPELSCMLGHLPGTVPTSVFPQGSFQTTHPSTMTSSPQQTPARCLHALQSYCSLDPLLFYRLLVYEDSYLFLTPLYFQYIAWGLACRRHPVIFLMPSNKKYIQVREINSWGLCLVKVSPSN